MKTVGMPGDPNLDAVQVAFAALADLSDQVILVGGCATGLLITSVRSEMIRPTRDVDLIVEITSRNRFRHLERDLRRRGFVNDQRSDAPICRWRFDDVIIDLMPTDERVLGFGNRWYRHAAAHAERVLLPNGQAIRLVSAPVFLLTKLEAFSSRGADDLVYSHDLEDVMTVLDGREELESEIAAAPVEIREALRRHVATLLADDRLTEAMAGFLPGDAASQARLPELQAKLERLG